MWYKASKPEIKNRKPTFCFAVYCQWKYKKYLVKSEKLKVKPKNKVKHCYT